MVEYPDLSSLSEGGGIAELMALPNASYPFYWVIIMVALWIIITLTMYFKEKEISTRGNLLGAMAISAFAIIMLSTIGTLFNILTLPIYLPLLIGGLVIIAIWIFSS